ncbi:hypothetical protein Gotri_017754 [Gossypium trilobum]|uniref:CRAL-TRIO domain-containing protein n=1 Tax=Gossypium trilobum TaxID=34281 RepID=A0A7J9E8W5_9ROSI|nr:hypothetical protein [Gossypium trilobum]
MFLRRKHTQKDDSEQRDAKVIELRTAIGPLSGRCSLFCTDACLMRYLEARNWNVDKARKMLEETLKWRSTYKPEEICWHEVAHEGETGKVSRASFHDRQGRTVLILRPGMQNTTSAENNIRHLVYLLENAIINLSEGQEQMSWLIDFTGFSLNTSVPIRTARDIIYILQSHYPERLAIAFLYNPPRFFEAFYKNLPNEFGGNATLKYDHEEFSRLMAQDDVKTAKFWGIDEKPYQIGNGHSVAPEPAPISQQAG